MFSNYALKLWGEIIPFLRSDDELTEELADKLMLTSTIAGMAIAQTGTSIPHALSYDVHIIMEWHMEKPAVFSLLLIFAYMQSTNQKMLT